MTPQPTGRRLVQAAQRGILTRRSFIQTDESAVSKGFPTHAEAARAILADAGKAPENLLQHQGWVLFIKHVSSKHASTADG